MILERSATLWNGRAINTWEPEKHLQHAADLVQGYWEATKLIEQHRAGSVSQSNKSKPEGETQQPETGSLGTSGRQIQRPSRLSLWAYIASAA